MFIYYAPESNIRVKSYDHMSLAKASVVQFRASQYIIGLNQTSESKVMAVCLCLVLPCFILNISIYYAPESGIWVKSYAIWVSRELRCSISIVSTYYWPESDIWVKSYGSLNFPCASMFNFEHLNILCTWIGHLSEKLCHMR